MTRWAASRSRPRVASARAVSGRVPTGEPYNAAVTAAEMERLVALLRIPRVSARPDHAADMAAAAELCADEVRGAGGRVDVLTTAGHPLVVGEVPASDGRADAPRVLLYGHYDVQPPGPPELWSTPAFEPT